MPGTELLGKTIMGYQVVQAVGAGAYGTVYRVVKQGPLGTYTRALKHISIPTQAQYEQAMLSMGGDESRAGQYFERLMQGVVDEVRTLSSLSELDNGHIVRYYESDMTMTSQPRRYDVFVLMEFLAPFKRYEELPASFTVRDVLRFAYEVLDGIGFCHEHGVIHRDIKEGNIFVSESGAYKIGDFGIAKKVSTGESAVSIKGTPSSIAPEVYLGKESYTRSVDLYSLGMVLYRLLNHGRNPFLPPCPEPYYPETEEEAFARRLRGEVPPLPTIGGRALGSAVVHALLDARQRYQTAAEFAAALRAAEAASDAATLATSVREGDSTPVVVRRQAQSISVVPSSAAPAQTFDINALDGASGVASAAFGVGGASMSPNQGGGYYATGYGNVATASSSYGSSSVVDPNGVSMQQGTGTGHMVEPAPKGKLVRNLALGVAGLALVGEVAFVVARFALGGSSTASGSGSGSSGTSTQQTTTDTGTSGGTDSSSSTQDYSTIPSGFDNPYHGSYGVWTDGTYSSDVLDLRIVPKGVVQPYYADSSDGYPDFVYAWNYDSEGWAIAELVTAPELDGLDPASLESTVDGSKLEAVQLGGNTWYRNTYETDDGWHTELYYSVAGKMLAIHIVDPTYGAYTKLFLAQCSSARGVPDLSDD